MILKGERMKLLGIILRQPSLFLTFLLFSAAISVFSPLHIRALVKPPSVIHVWTVGAPYLDEVPRDTVPLDLREQAQQLGYTIEVQGFSAAGFAARLQDAVNSHNEPEVITINNLGVLIGLSSPNTYQGVLQTDFRTAASLQ